MGLLLCLDFDVDKSNQDMYIRKYLVLLLSRKENLDSQKRAKTYLSD